MTSKKAEETKACILKAAGQLFVKHGVDGTSLRAITAKANVNLAAINYHFGSKEALVTEVLLTFIYHLDAERDQILTASRKKSPDGIPLVFDILSAYIQPWLDLSQKQPDLLETYARLYASSNTPEISVSKLLYEVTKKPYADFSKAIFQARPDIPADVLTLRMNIAITTAASVLINPWFSDNLGKLSGSSINRHNLLGYLERFIESGKFEKA